MPYSPKQAAEEGQGTVDDFLDLDERGYVNKERTTYGMAWTTMGQDKVQDKLNKTDRTDMNYIYILL